MKQQIINKLSKFSIIGMGENSHFVNYPTKYRFELFKQLCYQSNFNIICLETDIFYASIINAYIHSLISSDPEILVENLFHIWRTPLFIKFIKWAREYNWQVPDSRKIYFIGFDSQNPFIFRKNKILHSTIKKNVFKYYSKIFNVDSKHITELFSLYNTNYETTYGDTKLYDKYREKISFLIFMQHYKYILPTNKKIVIFAHQAHLSKIKSNSFPYGPFGYYIYEHFKNKFYSIAMDILTGKLACKKVLKGINISYGIKLLKKEEVALIDNNYNYSHECDNSLDEYIINPLKYHDAVLVFSYDKPITTNLTKLHNSILKKVKKYFKNNEFYILDFYKKYKVDIPNKYINLLN